MVVMLDQCSVVPAAEEEEGERLVPLMVGEAIQVVGEAVLMVERHLVAAQARAVQGMEAAAVGIDLGHESKGEGS